MPLLSLAAVPSGHLGVLELVPGLRRLLTPRGARALSRRPASVSE